QVKYNSIRFSEQQYATAKLREEMETKEYIKLTSQRAGVEGIPSVFRRVYNVDNMPVRGLVRSKIWFGIKVMASNVKKLFKSVKLAGI
ncbi:transposase, partial [Halanaerobium congolense]